MSNASIMSRRAIWRTMAIGAAGAALAAGAFWAAGNGTSQATAQEPAAGSANFTLSVAQLRINQRISSAAVRRSNEGLQLLDPIRPVQAQPNKVLGWEARNIKAGAVEWEKLAPPVQERVPVWAYATGAGVMQRQKGVEKIEKGPGNGTYYVYFEKDVQNCIYYGNVYGNDTGYIGGMNYEPGMKRLEVKTYPTGGGPASVNRSFMINAVC